MEMRERSSGWTLVLGYALSQVPAVRESKGTACFASLLPKTAVLSSWLNWGFPPYQPSPRGCMSGHRARAPAKGTESRCRLGHGFVRLDPNLCCMCPSPGPRHKLSRAKAQASGHLQLCFSSRKHSFYSIGGQEVAVPAAHSRAGAHPLAFPPPKTQC